MRVVRGISNWTYHLKRPVVAIGVFDGLHHGHRLLIQKMKQRASAIGGTSVVMTFDPHPVRRLHPEKKMSLISSLDYRLKLLEDAGVDACLVAHFTRRFAQMKPLWFIRQYLVKRLKVAEVVIGEDFHFGHLRRGNAALLRNAGTQMGFNVHVIPVLKSQGEKRVSSTRVRQLIRTADIDTAEKLLDRPVAILGKVIKGDRRGRLLGYPTANLDSKVTGIVPRGVYCTRIHADGAVLYGMANIGSRPTFKKNACPNIEVHIFDFQKSLYGKKIFVEFVKKIRDEKNFPSFEGLFEQLHQDESFARKWFLKHSE